MSSSAWFHKPENALKRSNELIAVGNCNAALELLHSVFSNRKYKQWQPAYETLMIQYLDLCIELKKHREAKDGLHQYRNMTQQQMPSSLEIIVNHLLKESELRVVKAKSEANAMSTAAEEDVLLVGDLEAESTPEGIMLSTMTDDGGRERTDREVVIPWLKFLWEAYRAVLDILKTNSKLENTYHNTCITAFNFCKVYGRTLEFKRLCETLRQHIQSLQKHSQKYGAVPSNRLRCWEGFTNECIELHLQTRFAQLEVAASLELWTEGFRTVEDIYNIMQIGRRVPKARLMASYYEKLTRIFFVSNNHLFHAYAWYKYYTLSREFNKALTAEERQMLACCVLLAALSIPEFKGVASSSDQGGVEAMLDEDDLTKEKNQRMSTLLGFNMDPSRANLLKELIAKGILNAVHPQLRFLSMKLEANSPLTVVESLKPVFDFIDLPENSATLGIYRPRLEKVIVLCVLKGLSERYSTVSLSNFRKYLIGLEMPYEAIEQTLVHATKNRELLVRIDHRAQALRFGSAQIEADGVRGQLTSLARQLARIASITSMAVSPLAYRTAKAKSDADRSSLFKVVASRLDQHQEDALKRKDVIEKRKENAERLEQERQREAAKARVVEERARREEEVQRLAREARVREREQKQKLEDDFALEQTKQVLGHYGKKIDNLEQMDRAEREQVIKNAKDEVLTEKEKEEKRRRDHVRRLDYIVRALRVEEAPILQQKSIQQHKANADEYAKRNAEYMVQHRKDWEKDTKDKAAMASILVHCRIFEDKALASRRVQWEEERKVARENFIVQEREARIERARERREEAQRQRVLAEKREEELLLMEMDRKVNADRMAAGERRSDENGKAVGTFEAAAPYELEGRGGMGSEPYSGHRGYDDSRGNVGEHSEEQQSWRSKRISQQPPEDERGVGLPGHNGDQFPGPSGFKRDYNRHSCGFDDRRRDGGPRDQHADQLPAAIPPRRGEEIQNTDAPPPRPRRMFVGKSLEELEKQGFSK